MNLTRFHIALVLVLLYGVQVLGQSNAGSISGTVKDNNGATVPGATVTIVNPANSFQQTATTNDDGIFTAPQLPPGNYTVNVVKEGFKTTQKTDVILSTSDKLSLGDIVLEVGDVAATVQVQADAGQLQIKSESGERSDLITNRQIRDIALNGRNVLDLTKLIPGIVNTNQGAQSTVNNAGGTFNVNGLRSNMHEITLDGATNINLGNNTGLLVTISPDATAEVKVLTSNYQAEYGRAAGGFVQLTTKSGTNDYHGTGRYFRRHDSLNANSFFNNGRNLPRSIYRYNFYGYDIGGPVYLPRFGQGGPSVWSGKNKLFFFFSQEIYRQVIPSTSNNVRVPTAAERNGDFSNSRDTSGNLIVVRDANNCLGKGTGTPFTGNVIPQQCWYGQGQPILNLYPMPNIAVSNNAFNYTSQVSSSLPRGEQILRIDYNIGNRGHFSWRMDHNTDQQIFPYGTTTASFNFPLVPVARGNGPGWTYGFNLTYNLSSTMINEFNFAPSRGAVFIFRLGDAASRSGTGLNLPLLFPNANVGGAIPSISYDNSIGGAAGFSGITYADINFTGSPFNQHFSVDNFIDNLTKVAGNHTIKTGFYWQRAHNKRSSFSPVQSNIEFNFGTADAGNPLNTGYPFANALVGNYFQYQQASAELQNDFIYNNVEGYVQDTWKITPRLTLDYGLRLSYYQPMYDKEGQFANFDPSLFDASKAVRLYLPVCINGASTCASGTNRRAVDPLVRAQTGFVATAANTLPTQFIGTMVSNSGSLTNGMALARQGAPRGGIRGNGLLLGPRLGFAYDLTGKQKTVVRGGFGVAYDRINSDVTIQTITNPPNTFTPSLFFGRLTDISGLSGAGGALPPLAIFGADKNGNIPTVYSYSLGVQHNLGWGAVVDVSYVGNLARHLVRIMNLNAIPYGATFSRPAQDPTLYAGGVVPTVQPSLPAAYSQAGVNFTGVNALPNDFLRPYQGYGDIQFQSFDANSSYNGLQVNVTRRFTNNFTFGAAYTFSKTLTTANAVNEYTHPYNSRGYDYALANFDRTHVLVINYVYNLPKASRHLGNNLLTRGVLDNWQVSGVTQAVSGTPFELSLSGLGSQGKTLFGTPTTNGTGTLAGLQPRFVIVGDPRQKTNGLQINPNAFAVPGIGDTRAQSRFYLRNPGWINHDVSVFKNFPFSGEPSRYLQLRFEFFNLFNHTQFTGIQTGSVTITPGSPTPVFNVRPAGNTSVLGTFFGEYNATRDPRIVQLAVKMYF